MFPLCAHHLVNVQVRTWSVRSLEVGEEGTEPLEITYTMDGFAEILCTTF